MKAFSQASSLPCPSFHATSCSPREWQWREALCCWGSEGFTEPMQECGFGFWHIEEGTFIRSSISLGLGTLDQMAEQLLMRLWMETEHSTCWNDLLVCSAKWLSHVPIPSLSISLAFSSLCLPFSPALLSLFSSSLSSPLLFLFLFVLYTLIHTHKYIRYLINKKTGANRGSRTYF